MSLTGETIASGAPPRCPDCGVMPRIDVYRSAAGFYLGTAGFYLGTHDRGRQPPAVAAGQVDQPAVGAGRCRLDLELLREHEQPGRVGRVWVACLTDQKARRMPSPSGGATDCRKRFWSASKCSSPGAR